MPIPLNNATLVDALVLVLIGLYVLEDVRNGILYGLVQLAGLLLALLAALLFYSVVATELVNRVGLGYGLAKPLAFGGVWLLSDLVYSVTARRMTALASRDVARSTIGRLLGIFTGLARGIVVATLLLAIVAALPLPEPITRAVADSRIGSRLAERGETVQRALAGVLGDAVQESISMLTVRPESTERVNLSFRVAAPRIDADAETQMLTLVNRARAENGLEPVEVDPTIRDVARAYSTTMFQQGFFAHIDQNGATPFDRMRAGGATFRAAGENLALAPTVQIAHDGLMNSPGHRANILNPRYRRIGIGVADGGMHGKMFTQNFAD
ncbi:MAG TPA: CvpA family protein [Chloroflexota bacterium]|nr:CvpA family protein [Chloroflexota bacterium]